MNERLMEAIGEIQQLRADPEKAWLLTPSEIDLKISDVQKQVQEGCTTGDPAWDLLIVKYGDFGGQRSDQLRRLISTIESNAGELLLLTFGDTLRNADMEVAQLARVEAGAKVQINVAKGQIRIPTGKRIVVSSDIANNRMRKLGHDMILGGLHWEVREYLDNTGLYHIHFGLEAVRAWFEKRDREDLFLHMANS